MEILIRGHVIMMQGINVLEHHCDEFIVDTIFHLIAMIDGLILPIQISYSELYCCRKSYPD